jgi:hypothetical protein
VKIAACGAADGASDHVSSKSWSASSWSFISETSTWSASGRSMRASWYELATSASATPASIETAMSTGFTSVPGAALSKAGWMSGTSDASCAFGSSGSASSGAFIGT